MKKEREYTLSANQEHIKKFGQYFTNYDVAKFMATWVSKNASTLLDPAVGNSVFLQFVKKSNSNCELYGYEIDDKILDYFGNPAEAQIKNEDYLLTGWDERYDAIICNPPYNRFQAVTNRAEIIKEIEKHTGIKYSGYTNLYILFLLKSLYQLSDSGRLAYIIPTEFLNSKYGTPIKEKLVREKLLRAIINFKNDQELFFNATTTCCILLVDKEEKTSVDLYNLDSVLQLEGLDIDSQSGSYTVSYEDLCAEKKWREYINQEERIEYRNLTQVSVFCSVSRGIATGANSFFCLTKSQIKKINLPESVLSECICKSADVQSSIFKREDFNKLADSDRTVFLLDIKDSIDENTSQYIAEGERTEINKKYLLSCRKPWYSMERKPIAPIWVSSACRDRIKFVRNLAGVKSLTTFHSIFVNPIFSESIDIIFCYFLTPIAQEILRKNRKELGNGLEKFQPDDLKQAQMLDITVVSDKDRMNIQEIYTELKRNENTELIVVLNDIFKKYICH